MRIETVIETLSWIISGILLFIYVQKNKIRDAHIIFLFKQVITWPIGFAVAEMNLIEYPIRFFDRATRSSFTFEYFVYPSIAVLFVLYFPSGSSWIKKCIYYISYSSTLTIIEGILERYTQLINYIHWHWYWTWLAIIITLYLTKTYYAWFFKIRLN